MAAAEVIVVDDGLALHHYQGTERIERLLEAWYKDLRVNVVNEFLQFKSSVEDEQQRAINEIQSKPSPEVMKLRRETENLRDLLHTLERSVSQKDKLVSNLVKSLEKEKDKYEKLRAVSSDRWERSSEEFDENTVAAEKQYSKNLLGRCLSAWKSAVRLKDQNGDTENPEESPGIIVHPEVKIEEAAGESPTSNDVPLRNERVENDGLIVTSASMVYGQATSTSDERTYPAYQTALSTEDYHSTQTTTSIPAIPQSFSIMNTGQDQCKNGPADDTATTSHSINNTDSGRLGSVSEKQPPKAGPSLQKIRGRKRAYAKNAYERGKKMYEIKDKIRIKKVQSLRDGSSFLNSDGRPTMATNAFQVQLEESGVPPSLQPTSIAQSTQLLTHNEPYGNQDIIINPHQTGEQNPDTTIVHVQPQFGPIRNDWEAAKNNISQYMNQMLNKPNDVKDIHRHATENTPIASTTSAATDTLLQNESKIGSANSQTAAISNPSQLEPGEGHRCSLCAHKFDSEEVLQRHIKICPAKPKDSPKWVCKECGKSFVSGKRYLQDHIMMVHKGMPPYRCDVCLKGFTTLANFKSHVLLHGSDRPFNCSQCQRGFAQKGNFLRHMKGVHGMQITFKSRKR